MIRAADGKCTIIFMWVHLDMLVALRIAAHAMDGCIVLGPSVGRIQ